MVHLILKGLDTQTSFARFRREVRALFSLLSLLIKFTRDLTAQEARKSQDSGIGFGRKTGRRISIGPLLLHCGRIQDLKHAHLSEAKNKARWSGEGMEGARYLPWPWAIGPQ